MKKNIIKFWAIIAICVGLFGSCTEKESNAHLINGCITDELGSPITNVVVVMQANTNSFTTKTDSEGKYKFENLPIGSYNVSLTKQGFKTEIKNLSIVWDRNTEYDCSLKNTMGLLVGEGLASVVITDFMSISDGAAFWLKASTGTKKFCWYYWSDSEKDFTDYSDVEIIAEIMKEHDTIESSNNNYAGCGYNNTSNTKYTYYFVAFDSQGKVNSLTKQVISTKSATNQPLAAITLGTISNGQAYFNIAKNSYCSYYPKLKYLFYNYYRSSSNIFAGSIIRFFSK